MDEIKCIIVNIHYDHMKYGTGIVPLMWTDIIYSDNSCYRVDETESIEFSTMGEGKINLHTVYREYDRFGKVQTMHHITTAVHFIDAPREIKDIDTSRQIIKSKSIKTVDFTDRESDISNCLSKTFEMYDRTIPQKYAEKIYKKIPLPEEYKQYL